jgi:hypothetical protein
LKAKYTYAEFKRECAKIGKVDLSRLAKDHMQRKPAAEVSKRSTEVVDGVGSDSDSDSDIEILLSSSVGGGKAWAAPKKVASSTKKQPRKRQKTEEVDNDKYSRHTKQELEAECVSAGLPKSGKKADLIARLEGPHPPKLWLKRKGNNEFVPASYNDGGTALLVAMYLHERETGPDNAWMTKDELYSKAEGLNITKNVRLLRLTSE